MTISTQRPHARGEASMAIFARAELEPQDRSTVFSALGEMAVQVSGKQQGAGELPGFSQDDFRYFESQLSPYEVAMVDYRKGLLEGYEPFRGEAERIKMELKVTPAKDIKGFLASGNESNVFIVESEDKPFALRMSKNGNDSQYRSAEHIDSYLEGAFRAAHIDGMEKLAGLSYENGVTVGEIVPGKPMAEYSAEEIAAIPLEHYTKLARIVIEAAEAGISLDGNEGNLLYDPRQGFGFVDFGAMSVENRGIAQPVTCAVFGTDTWLPSGRLPESEYAEDYEVLKEVLVATIPSYDRWVAVLAETQKEMGLDANYLTRISELEQTSANLKTALEELSMDEAIERLTQKSQDARQKSIENIERQLEDLEEGFIRDNKLQRLVQRKQLPGRLFPKGSIRPTRNDNRQ